MIINAAALTFSAFLRIATSMALKGNDGNAIWLRLSPISQKAKPESRIFQKMDDFSFVRELVHTEQKIFMFDPLWGSGWKLPKLELLWADFFFFLGPSTDWPSMTGGGAISLLKVQRTVAVVKKSGHKNFFAWLSPSLLGIQRSILPWIHNWKSGCQTFAHYTFYRKFILFQCVFSEFVYEWGKDFWPQDFWSSDVLLVSQGF